MKKYVKLNAPVYGKSNYLQCESTYRKGIGYCIEIEPVEYNGGLVSMVFCKEYFDLGNAGQFLVDAATRRSGKKQAETDARLEMCLADFVNKYLNRINRTDLHAVKE